MAAPTLDDLLPYVTAIYRSSLGYRPLANAPANALGYLDLFKADPALVAIAQGEVGRITDNQLDQRDHESKVRKQMLQRMLNTFQGMT